MRLVKMEQTEQTARMEQMECKAQRVWLALADSRA